MMTDRRVHDASLPLFAAWSTESPIYTTVVFLQVAGNELRAVGSRHWKLKPLHTCIDDVIELARAEGWRIRTHVTPPDPDGVLEEQFSDQGLVPEAAPKLPDVVLLTRRLFATLKIDQDANEDLLEAINSYAPREEPHGFVVTPGHTLARFFVRALEVFASWRHAGGLDEFAAWGAPVDYSQADRAVV